MRRWLFTFTDPSVAFASVRVLAPTKLEARGLIEGQLAMSANYETMGNNRVIAAYFGNARDCDVAKIESAVVRHEAAA